LTGFQDLHFLVANVIRAEIVKKLNYIFSILEKARNFF
jgi:hypothetical protein